MQPWIAEREVDAELARALIREQFPALGGEVTPFGAGWDNSAFVVDGVVFRFPRRQVAVALLERECRVLPSLQGLPVAVPNPIYLGRPTERFVWPFAGYPMLRGQSACGVGDEVRQNVAPSLGAMLRALHAHDPSELGGDEVGRHRVRPPSPGRPQLFLHGDLYARHLLIDGGQLTGIIDWGDVHRGDRSIDLSVAWSFLPPSARADFRDAYGPIDDESWELARYRALTHSDAIVRYTAEVGDEELHREALRALGNSRSE